MEYIERNIMNVAVILAGGIGSRLGLNKPKQFMKIAGKTILEHTVDVFQKNELIDEVAIVVNGSYIDYVENLVLKNQWNKVKKILHGGKERYESSLSAIRAYENLNKTTDVNLVFHDAVRPLVSNRIIKEVIYALESYSAVDVAIPSADTIVQLDPNREFISNIPDRKFLNRGQTPQAFKYNVIKKAYEIALKDSNLQTTDDCGIVCKYLPEIKVYVVKGEEQNIKLTYPEDIYVLDKLFQIKSAILTEKVDYNDLNGKIIMIFGGNSGIGLDIKKLAVKYGAQCYSFSRSLSKTDISCFNDVKDAFDYVISRHERIDFVVNTAAVLNKEPLIHLTQELVSNIINVNYIGMINISIVSYAYLKESKGQLLHFTSSSYTRGRANYALYSSTKAAVVNFVQAIAEEWERDDIRVNCINPQRTKTPMRISNFGIEPDNTLLKSEYVAEISLKTLLSNFNGEVVDVKL